MQKLSKNAVLGEAQKVFIESEPYPSAVVEDDCSYA